MSKNLNSPAPETTDMGLSSDAIARRRMLLKSLSKGSSVVAAAAIPMHTLAGTGTLAKTTNSTRCTVSSMASAVHSKDTTTAICTGCPPSHYSGSSCANWPGYNTTKKTCAFKVGQKDCTEKTTFKDAFGCGSTKTLQQAVNNQSTTDECVWATALLNSVFCYNSTYGSNAKVQNYPYTPTEVVAFCNNPNKSTTAMTFFKTHMQG